LLNIFVSVVEMQLRVYDVYHMMRILINQQGVYTSKITVTKRQQ